MSKRIRTDVIFDIKEGRLDDFKAHISKMIENTAEKEPDALVYEWYVSEDGREGHLLESFTDSDAFLLHLKNIGPFLDPLWEVSTLTGFKTFGNPSPDLQEALASFPKPIDYFAHTNGLTR